jgi:hypothetical protein
MTCVSKVHGNSSTRHVLITLQISASKPAVNPKSDSSSYIPKKLGVA